MLIEHVMSIVFIPITPSERRVQDYYSGSISAGQHLLGSKLNCDCDQYNAIDLQIIEEEEEVGIIIIMR